jgi:hypothetical protein
LDVRIDGKNSSPCGRGCYRVDVRPGRRVDVDAGAYTARFAVPAHAPPADALVRAARAAYRALRSVVYRERLASGPAHAITTLWRLEKPSRVAYSIAGGAQGVIVGGRRWDRDSRTGRWQESPQTPLPQPATQWTYSTNAHVLAQTATRTTVSFLDPTIPAYFTLSLDRRTLLPHVLHMTASAHFMTDRYLRFNAPPSIRPPR